MANDITRSEYDQNFGQGENDFDSEFRKAQKHGHEQDLVKHDRAYQFDGNREQAAYEAGYAARQAEYRAHGGRPPEESFEIDPAELENGEF